MFERPHHRRVAQLLQSLDGLALVSRGCLFGGGTAMALRHGEYRESVDIDFLVSHLDGYRQLRQLLAAPAGMGAITRPGHAVQQLREMRTDQYGIRTLLAVDEVAIKFEIVLEARIELQPPLASDQICGVPTLTPLDMATSKLLANCDRWADSAVFSRDLIDLAMMAPPRLLLQQALAKAGQAYGSSVQADLRSAVNQLRQQPGRLQQCMVALRMEGTPRALLWSRVRGLEAALPRGV